jgi:hypothetical protein
MCNRKAIEYFTKGCIALASGNIPLAVYYFAQALSEYDPTNQPDWFVIASAHGISRSQLRQYFNP